MENSPVPWTIIAMAAFCWLGIFLGFRLVEWLIG